jgi:hypothetical protein
MELNSNKEILICLGMCTSQSKIKNQYINYELNMIYFKGGVNPTSIGSLNFEDTIQDDSYLALLPLKHDSSIVIVVFADCLLLAGLITAYHKCELVLIRKIRTLDNSRHRLT